MNGASSSINQAIGQCVAALIQLDKPQAADVVGKLLAIFGAPVATEDKQRPKRAPYGSNPAKTRKRERKILGYLVDPNVSIDSNLTAAAINMAALDTLSAGTCRRTAHAARYVAKSRGTPDANEEFATTLEWFAKNKNAAPEETK